MAPKPSEGLKLLAERTGVSVSTVSRVLSGKAEKARISEKTRDLVMKEAKLQGIVVNEVARSLRLQTTHTVGLLIPDISNPFFAALARQAARASRERGYSVLLCDCEEDTEVEARNVMLMRSRRVDGLVIAPVGGRHEHLEAVMAAGTPLVLLDRIFPDLAVPGVAADNAAGAALAVNHLIKAGHKRIGCLQGLPESSTNAARVDGFLETMQRNHLPVPGSWVTGRDYTLESARNDALGLLSQKERPTAIVALGNIIALGVLHAARELRLKVPDDLSLVSFDDQPWAELISPPLTTVDQPVDMLGERAMELFFKILDDSKAGIKNSATRIVLPMRLIERGSVKPLK